MDPVLSVASTSVGVISPSTAHTLSFIFTTSYVGSLYLSQILFSSSPTKSRSASPKVQDGNPPVIPPIDDIQVNGETGIERGPKRGSRDHPETIKRRMTAVTISTSLSLAGVYLTINNISQKPLLSLGTGSGLGQSMTVLGLRLPTFKAGLWGLVGPWVLAPILVTGPLLAMFLDGELPIIGNRYHGESVTQRIGRGWRELGLIELRNYGVGPITEELVFRSTILSVSILGGLSFKSLVFGTPLWFGIAHAHHALETFRKQGSTKQAAIQAVLGCLFQLSYTTLFGWFASYLFLRAGSVIPPLTSHIFCNVMGIYLPSTAIHRHQEKKALIWGSYIAGIIGFIWGVRKI
ncbi:uncharacterized protein IL334_000372 [Kwoniella shivajii]|uniref:intramembrane prenyl-peptidase Rce1 n=1 Tax=Kwoniella shivajii TaxID=564305 RepID=A0ABZ1CQ28_9TREE|nr:hypothetical protein IL334_000372 [Kwoniella shivajii]